MEKYFGCNIVDSVVTVPENKPVKKRGKKSAIARWIISFLCVGAIFGAAYLPFAEIEPVKQTMRSVFFYDVFGREDIGQSVFSD